MKKGFIRSFRKSKLFKGIILKMVLVMLFQIGYPSVSFALTSGPGQPEFASFEPASTSDMVDLYSGGFTYNIPLLSVPGPNGGYPINIAYHSGAGMDEEASWVGLGWTLNVGAVNRQLQGVPDDINGQNITYKMDQKNSVTVGLNVNFLPFLNNNDYYGELFGNSGLNPNPNPPTVSFSSQLYFNNYKGIGVRVSEFSLNTQKGQDGNNIAAKNGFAGFINKNIGLSFDSQNGIGVSTDLGIVSKWLSGANLSFNSRSGFNGFNYTMGNRFLTKMSRKIGRIKTENLSPIRTSRNNDAVSAISRAQDQRDDAVRQSSSLSYSRSESLPSVTVPTTNWYVPVNMRLIGNGTFIGKWNTKFDDLFEGYVSIGKQKDGGNFTAPAYGYLYANKGSDDKINDYTKENIQYNKKTPYLAPSRNTFDVFMYTAQGSGGTFRPYHSEIMFFNDGKKESKNFTVGPTIEFATGTSTTPVVGTHKHFGLDVSFGYGTNTSGDWQTGKLMSEQNIASTHMRVYGEQTGIYNDENYFDEWDGDAAVRFKLGKTGSYLNGEYKLENELLFEEGNSAQTNPSLNTQTANRRSHMVRHLTNTDAQAFGVSRLEGSTCSVKYYDSTSGTWINKPYSGGHIYNNHISEIQVIQPGGVKYIYGLPAYNKLHNDVSASVTSNGDHNVHVVDDITSATSYQSTLNKFYSKTSYPAYAHSWLLTHVVSADYIDSDNTPGPSDGDIGYWVKFNYRKTHDNYKWRVPYEGANYIRGHADDPTDNMATYSYGEKEIYYIQTIETKTHIAVFEISVRKDAREVSGEYAQTPEVASGAKLYKLDRIKLYSKKEYYVNCGEGINSNAVPLQTVHFSYDYSLCPGIPNNNGNQSLVGNETANQGGKLTLKKIWFTSENSTRGSLSPYKFDYTNNESYGVQNTDRWGNFKPNTTLYGTSANYPYKDFPYTEQERAIDNPNYVPPVAQWALNKIDLPTGGVLNIQYEPNDYSYVEDKPAMRMFDIIGVGNRVENEKIEGITPNSKNAWTTYNNGVFSGSSSLPVRNSSTATYTFLEHENFQNNGYTIFFELEEPVNYATDTIARNIIIRDKYVKGMQRMWFRNYTAFKADALYNLQKSYVSGYVELLTPHVSHHNYFGMCKKPGAVSTDPYTIGYITVKRIPLQENNLGLVKCNEMTRFALQHLKLERPDIAFSPMPQNNQFVSQVINLLGVLGPQILDDAMGMLLSYNLWSYTKDYGKYIELNGKSVVRLYDPDNRKYGNGARVKKLWIDDNWSNNIIASVEDDANYGQEYIYTLDGTITGQSSGVAYEPRVGGEESALREPVIYEHSSFLASTNTLFIEKPILESYYPGASVGYSKVTVKSIAASEAAADGKYVNSTATPTSVYEFYTPKDFPVYGDETDLSSAKPLIRTLVIPGIYTDLRIKKARSQGYSIVTNDMAGKLKSTSSYTRNNDGTNGTLIASQEYIYSTINNYDPNAQNKLKNDVQVLVPDAVDSDVNFRTATLGQTVDIFVERNENRSVDYTGGLQTNFEFGTLGASPAIPYFGFEIYPEVSRSELSFKTVVVHKVIHRSGVLKKIIAKTDQSTVQTENLAFDIETGEPLLTSVTNQYDDPVYSLSYPAQWYYKNLGPAYQNADFALTGTINITNAGASVGSYLSGSLITSNNISKFTVGDQLYLGTSTPIKVHVIYIDNTNLRVYVVGPDGSPLSTQTATSLYTMTSGYKNQQTAKAGGVGFKKLVGFNQNYQASAISLSFQKVLQASAVEYSDEWQSRCTTCSGDVYSGKVLNPFRYGFKGLWRLSKSYAYLTDRLSNNNSQEDGILATFTQYPWRNPASAVSDWISAGTITKYSPFGFELENKDPLGNYSAAQYGYNNSLPTAVAVNSRYNEIFFDGFEDYYNSSCVPCIDDHFRWLANVPSIKNTQAHSGYYSMEVPQGASSIVSPNVSVLDPSACSSYRVFSSQIGNNGTSTDAVFDIEDNCNCIGKLALIAGKKYVLNTWVKHVTTGSTGQPVTYNGLASVKVQFYDINSALIGSASVNQVKGKIIEGWQQLEGDFTVPGGTTRITFTMQNDAVPASFAYFDDMRLHPFDGNMNSFVYDYRNFKVLAELDENNYATFYVYDEAGNLIMKKKETAKGIMTLTEGRSDVPKEQ